MPVPKPLTPLQARSTLAHRYTRKADIYRQFYTKYGLHDKRVFLVWTQWDGEFRGEGNEVVRAEVELLPTPRVSSLNAVSYRPYSHGTFPEGSIRLDRISGADYTSDMLKGVEIPKPEIHPCGPQACGPVNPLQSEPIRASGNPPVERTTDVHVDFWYEVVEDGRGDDPANRTRYRLLSTPNREPGRLQWVVMLERASESLDRLQQPQEATSATAQSRDLIEDGQTSLVDPTYDP